MWFVKRRTKGTYSRFGIATVLLKYWVAFNARKVTIGLP